MKLTIIRIAKALAKTCTQLPPKDHAEAINAALTFARQKGLSKEILKFLPAFTKAWKTEHGLIETKLTSAKKEEPHTIALLQKALEKHYQKKITLETHVDGTLLAGYVLQIEDKRIDTSLKTRLADLAANLRT